jgi:hypothetical protein
LTKIQVLKEKLEQGFYVDNLYDMARLCKDMAMESKNPAPFFIMQKIFSGIADYWDNNPIIVEEAKIVEGGVLQGIKELIEGIENNMSGDQMQNIMNKVVSSYLFFLGRGRKVNLTIIPAVFSITVRLAAFKKIN